MDLCNDDRMIQVKVDGTVFGLTVQDYGTHWKVRAYRDDRVIGFKDYPIRVELTQKLFQWTVKSILQGGSNEKSATT